jgi:hypothetical protein
LEALEKDEEFKNNLMEKAEAIQECLGDSLVEGREAFQMELCDLDKNQKRALVDLLVSEGALGGDVHIARSATQTQASSQPKAAGAAPQ